MISKEEYIKLIEEIYNQENDELDDLIDQGSWIPSEPLVRKKPIPKAYRKTDITNFKRAEIKVALTYSNQLVIGDFLIIIEEDDNNLYSMKLYGTKYKTASGRSCNIQYKIDPKLDSRFEKCYWLTYFNFCIGSKIPENTALDIIKWFQAVNKLPAFT